MTHLAASGPVFSILTALVEERAGLHYGLSEQELFLERVAARAVTAGFESLLDYYYFLRYDPAGGPELEKLVDALVVNETFFFRELEPLRVIVSRFIEPRVRAGHRPRIWSAACATGEEPLTLAMLLSDADLLGKVDLVASDISARVLERARSGRYGKRSLRDSPDARLAARFLQVEENEVVVSSHLRDAIQWKSVNLCARSEVSAIGICDVILCRNVLIYFGDETASKVLQSLSAQLKPDGALFVGISESLLRFGTALACEEVNHVFFYRKETQ